MTLYGILDLDLWQVVLAGLVLTHITIVTVTVFLHRSQAHRALDLHPAVNHFFRFWLVAHNGHGDPGVGGGASPPPCQVRDTR